MEALQKTALRRIDFIQKVYEGGMTQYRIKLCPYFSFDFSGSDVVYVLSIREAYESTKHIIFCNGEN